MVTWSIQVKLFNQNWCDLIKNVSLDSYTLIQQSDTCFYNFSHSPNVAGNYQDNFPLVWMLRDIENNEVLSIDDNTAKPIVSNLQTPGNHSLSSDLMIYFTLENVDSCRVFLGKVEKKLNANSTTCTFTSTEMESLTCGKAYLTFALINYTDSIIDNESVSLIRENIVQKNFRLIP